LTKRGVAVLVVGLIAVAGVVATAVSTIGSSKSSTIGGYLALGDSITFGYREANTFPPPNYADPASFVGFPEDVGSALGLQVTNAACAGETSSELLHAAVSTIACPLHVSYTGTQMQFATNYLRSHPNTKLVSLMIGVNDILSCQSYTVDNCASQLPSVLQQLSENVGTILSDIRAIYSGTIVAVSYYPIEYQGKDEVTAVNQAVRAPESRYHVTDVDGWGAFEAAAAGVGGRVCAAGLLTQLLSGGCGIHPSVAGQAVLALAVEEAVHSTSEATTSTTAPSSLTCPPGLRRGPAGTCISG
jgi:lysophospholipase L1-like esterase